MIQLLASLPLLATTEASGIEALGIDPVAIVVQGATFLVLFFLLKKFAFGKIAGVLEKRRAEIDRSLSLTSELDQQKTELSKQVESILRSARTESDTILQKTRSEAASLIARAETQAKKRAEQVRHENEIRMTHELELAKKELKKEMADLVASATGAILRESSSPSHERKLIEMYLREVL